MTQAQRHSGAWIFVSHSHRDLGKVREIRNYLEKKGASPLLFFLKCLSDDDARLPELIADEIKARNFFVLCESPNAKASKYVHEEVALVESLGKPREIIDLSLPLEPQFHKLDRLLKRATVFLSYGRKDEATVQRIRHTLEQHDYAVWKQSEIPCGGYWNTAFYSAIDEAIARGFVLVLLSPASLTSEFCKQETEYALQRAEESQQSNVIPVVISPLAQESFPPQLANIQCFDLTTGPLEDRVEDLIRNLKTREME
ncbi:toll/interleukin-1 receptor domain-containing protein [Haloferula sp. A504]|uniref:toll/interleukin-1 receptor domain-containing protein n=1 Tax=Haloferula sp. A504 TaxID=3373601 RepID=UPI0031BCAC5C|nr:toll/interleukin-1 receptor domain-containing protein [Verrucomicrobiaceae bacterium E54]